MRIPIFSEKEYTNSSPFLINPPIPALFGFKSSSNSAAPSIKRLYSESKESNASFAGSTSLLSSSIKAISLSDN